MSQREVYISIDIESDGPAPGIFSMLSLGAAAMSSEDGLLDTFLINLKPLEGAAQDPETMRWWAGQREAWSLISEDPQDPSVAMRCFADWLDGIEGKKVAIGFPITFDFAFVNYYLLRFVGSTPLGFAGLDIKSYAMAVLGEERFSAAVKRRFPRRWFAECPRHTHVPVDDALEQGQLFLNIRTEHLGS